MARLPQDVLDRRGSRCSPSNDWGASAIAPLNPLWKWSDHWCWMTGLHGHLEALGAMPCRAIHPDVRAL